MFDKRNRLMCMSEIGLNMFYVNDNLEFNVKL